MQNQTRSTKAIKSVDFSVYIFLVRLLKFYLKFYTVNLC